MVVPLAMIGVLSAVLMWKIEHVGSIPLAAILFGSALGVAIAIARHVRRRLGRLTDYYESLLRTAEEESRRAEAASRVKDDVLSALSHELRTPLNSVLGWARLLAGRKLDAGMTAKAVQAIERAGWAQSRAIEDLLELSQIVGGRLKLHPHRTLIAPVIDAAIQSLRPAADGKHIAIDASIDQTTQPVTLDPDRLQQIVWHLLSNAIKFTPPGGSVRISAGLEGSNLWLDVSDTGIGFEPDASLRLFESFRQGDEGTTRRFAGLGLGLGLVRQLVELHGGAVSANSRGRNRGATFHVRLPLRSEEAPAAPGAPASPKLTGVSVLVVDDDATVRELMRSTLEESGAVVWVAATAEEGREHFARERPDVIVSDLHHPEAASLDLIRTIRSMEPSDGHPTPAAALSAFSRSEDRRRALEAGYQIFLAKPVDPAELVFTVEHLARTA